MAADEQVLAELADPDGRSVVLLDRIWESKITRDHPELRDHLQEVLATVEDPDHAEPDPRTNGAATTGAASAQAAGCWWS